MNGFCVLNVQRPIVLKGIIDHRLVDTVAYVKLYSFSHISSNDKFISLGSK
jgi:hypothetical protein